MANRIVINWAGLRALETTLAARLDDAIAEGVFFAQANCPVDTSSLQESIRVEPAVISLESIQGKLIAGGEDFTGQIMPSTGKDGKLVNYAGKQEKKHGFLVNSIPTIIDKLC